MGIFIVWLVPAIGVALLLRALIRTFTATWHPSTNANDSPYQILRRVLRDGYQLGLLRVMPRFRVLLLGFVLTTGCELVYVVPPADGRIVDARSHEPVVQADVTRIHAEAPAKTKTDAKGYF